jgi:hypothetical protein
MLGIKVNFLTSRGPVSFTRRTLLHVVSYTGQKPFHTLALSVPHLTRWFKTNSYKFALLRKSSVGLYILKVTLF